jgi:hypothetical protein
MIESHLAKDRDVQKPDDSRMVRLHLNEANASLTGQLNSLEIDSDAWLEGRKWVRGKIVDAVCHQGKSISDPGDCLGASHVQ